MSLHRPRKRFGQNFLQDAAVIHRIIAAVRPSSHDHIVEIGPGQGALTQFLVPAVQRFDAIELDRDLIPGLQAQFATHPQFHLHQSDVLKFDWHTLPKDQTWRVVGNLPYNISSPLLIQLFHLSPYIKDMHVMLQKEVADRLVANPGIKQFGRLTVMAQYHCKVTKLFEIPPSAFNPPPKVTSAMIVLSPKTSPSVLCDDLDALATITRHAFSQRRKTLSNALKAILPNVDWSAMGIDASARPEQIAVDDYVRLANMWLKRGSQS